MKICENTDYLHQEGNGKGRGIDVIQMMMSRAANFFDLDLIIFYMGTY
jgi:hypothetical protein